MKFRPTAKSLRINSYIGLAIGVVLALGGLVFGNVLVGAFGVTFLIKGCMDLHFLSERSKVADDPHAVARLRDAQRRFNSLDFFMYAAICFIGGAVYHVPLLTVVGVLSVLSGFGSYYLSTKLDKSRARRSPTPPPGDAASQAGSDGATDDQ